jgi:hypothetical protein
MTIGLFEVTKTTNQTMVNNLTKYLIMDWEKNKIAYVKDEGSNLNIMTTTLKSIVRCESLGLDENFQGTCFCFALSKAY